MKTYLEYLNEETALPKYFDTGLIGVFLETFGFIDEEEIRKFEKVQNMEEFLSLFTPLQLTEEKVIAAYEKHLKRIIVEDDIQFADEGLSYVLRATYLVELINKRKKYTGETLKQFVSYVYNKIPNYFKPHNKSIIRFFRHGNYYTNKPKTVTTTPLSLPAPTQIEKEEPVVSKEEPIVLKKEVFINEKIAKAKEAFDREMANINRCAEEFDKSSRERVDAIHARAANEKLQREEDKAKLEQERENLRLKAWNDSKK